MLSHEPKNYALLTYDDVLVLRGVAFRSSRSEPFGEAFLRGAIRHLLAGHVAAVRELYLSTIAALRARALPTYDVSSRVRLTKTPEQYLAVRDTRRELPYEAMLLAGRRTWSAGERVRVYRTSSGQGALIAEPDDDGGVHPLGTEPRDYDADHYVRVLRDTFAARFVRALAPEDFAAVFADPDQPSLFAPAIDRMRPVLTITPAATGVG